MFVAAVARELFYDRLEDFAEHPRIVVISVHLVDEVANLLEHVLLLDRGRLVLDTGLEIARAGAHTVAGPAAVAGPLTEQRLERKVSREQRIGALRTVTVAAPHDDAVSLPSAVATHGLVPAGADQFQNAWEDLAMSRLVPVRKLNTVDRSAGLWMVVG